MTINDKIRSLFRRRPLTEEELAARAEAEVEREQAFDEVVDHVGHANAQIPPTGY